MDSPDIDKRIAEMMGYTDFWQDAKNGLWYAYLPGTDNIEDDRMPIPMPSLDPTELTGLWDWARTRYRRISVETRDHLIGYLCFIYPAYGAEYVASDGLFPALALAKAIVLVEDGEASSEFWLTNKCGLEKTEAS